ncbi:hypothetical protein [Marinobacter sp. ELB17]|uniref:hypothetical protein n=1 Tax=Marinobacter sp. ELB17 TaxID=270374 RepID=UPI0003071169|nr:hypothetical protein [Marinobacter sp. ELB17]
MNTKIRLMYPGPHEKVEDAIILAGEITDRQIATIQQNLISTSGGELIAHQVGLPTLSEKTSAMRKFPVPGDHAYSVLPDWITQPELDINLHTQDSPTTTMTVDDLVARIEAVGQNGWDVKAEEARLNLDPLGLSGLRMNTRIELEYHTASDRKSATVILPGAITQEQADAIEQGMFDGFQVIAPQVGLPSLATNLFDEQGRSANSHDHVLTSLSDWLTSSPLAESLHTTDAPTLYLPIEDLAKRIQNIGRDGWDFAAEEDRLDIPADDYESPSM